MKNLKIDQFYIILGITLVFLAIIIAFSLMGIFGSINTSKEIDTDIQVDVNNTTINGVRLNDAIRLSYEKEYIPLDLK